jgi:hypothetical protein
MKKTDLTVGVDYAIDYGYGKGDSSVTSHYWVRVTILDLNHEYDKRVSAYNERTRRSVGILVRQDGGEKVLATARDIKRTWAQHEAIVKQYEENKTRDEIDRTNHNNAQAARRDRLVALGLLKDVDFEISTGRRAGWLTIRIGPPGLDKLLDRIPTPVTIAESAEIADEVGQRVASTFLGRSS